MSQARFKRFGRRLRIGFRAFRYVIWLLVIAVLSAVLYLNRVGLPDFAKQRILDQLRNRGIELEFRRVRLSFDSGLVADDVRFSGSPAQRGPEATARLVQLDLDWSALWQRKIRVAGLHLRDGRVRWQLTDTNREPRLLLLDHLQAALRFRTNDVWQLDSLDAQFAGARMRLSGAITNASAWREWQAGRAAPPTEKAAERLRARLFALAEQLERIQFSAPPDLRIWLHGDLRDTQHWESRLALTAAGAQTPWGSFTSGLLNARLLPAGTNGLRSVEVSLEAEAVAVPPWAEADSLVATLNVADAPQATNIVDARLELRAARAKTRWVQSGPLEFTGRWQHSFTNQMPLSGDADLRANAIESRWANVDRVAVKGRMQNPHRESTPDAVALGPWRFIEPYLLSAEIELDRLTTPKLTVDRAQFAANWKAPRLELGKYDVRLYRGGVRGTGALNALTRKVETRAEMDFDVQQFAPMMTAGGVRWLRQFAWANPPRAIGNAEAVLPAWTNRQPDWRREVLPTFRLDGEFSIGRGAFRQIPVESAASHVTYSNMIWRLPDLLVTRPEGVLRLEHIADDRSRAYYFRFDSAIDPRVLRMMMPTNQHRGFDLVQFGELPRMQGEVWGVWRRPELTGAAGTIVASNLTVRTEAGLAVRAAVQYTNRIITATQVQAWHGDRSAQADGVQVNIPADCLYLTNASGNVDPMVIARAIGPKTARSFTPYHFLNPPELHADGAIPLHHTNEFADLKVQIQGGPFEWWRLKVPQISGTVSWHRDSLTLSNVEAAFYGGRATGDARFSLKSGEETRMRFQLVATNADLNRFLQDVRPARSNVQGIVSGRLTITDAVSTNWQTWNGSGDMKIADGLLWDVPLFGVVFSTVLNVVVPGADLGKSRATEATATFGITNGVLHTDDMRVQTLLMVLLMRVNVTLDGQLDGRVEASLLREMWVLGPVISTVFFPVTKALEYKIGGTLQKPEVKPLYVPARLLLRPWRTLKEALFPENGPPYKSKAVQPPPIPEEKRSP